MKTEYTISQIAEKLHITTNKIRFYEKKGLLTPMRESQNRYRKFGEEDIFRLETILLYRSLGLSIEAIQNILQCNKKENYLTHMQNQWMAVNNEIHRLSEIRKSLETVLDKVYEESEEQELEKDFLKIIEQSNLLCQVKNEWKDQWDFDGWARAYDEDVKRDADVLKIYENYETVLQMVFEEVENFQRKDGKILEIGVGTGNLAGKFLQNKYHIIGIDQSRQMLAVAKEKYPKLHVRLGEFLKIPYENQTFDVIVSTYAFHHLNEEEKRVAIAEMMRVLKKDGRIILGDLMFQNKAEEQKIRSTLSPEQIKELNGEYYSYLHLLIKEVEQYEKRVVYVCTDESTQCFGITKCFFRITQKNYRILYAVEVSLVPVHIIVSFFDCHKVKFTMCTDNSAASSQSFFFIPDGYSKRFVFKAPMVWNPLCAKVLIIFSETYQQSQRK